MSRPSAVSDCARRRGARLAAPAVGDYVALLKPRVMSLVVFTGLVGLYLAPGHLHPVLAVVAVLCIAVAAGAAGAINMWYDRDIDAMMERTRDRPLPAGRMAPGDALGFGVRAGGRLGHADGARAQLGGGGAAGAHHRLLCLRLHDLAEAPHAAEHRHRRRGRRFSAAGRLGRGDRPDRRCRRWRCSRSSSSGRRRISGRWRSIAPATTPRPACRCCRWSPGPRETKRQMLLYTLVLWPVALAPALLGVAGWVYGAAALVAVGALHRLRGARAARSGRARGAGRCSASRCSISSCCSRFWWWTARLGLPASWADDADAAVDEREKQQRGKNLALLGVLVALVALFYFVAIVRMGAAMTAWRHARHGFALVLRSAERCRTAIHRRAQDEQLRRDEHSDYHGHTSIPITSSIPAPGRSSARSRAGRRCSAAPSCSCTAPAGG